MRDADGVFRSRLGVVHPLPRRMPRSHDWLRDLAGVTVTLHVCITCRCDGEALPGDGIRPGARLHQRLIDAGAPEGVAIRPVECLSACTNGCSVALSRPGSWSYVYGHMDPDAHVTEILAGAAAYAATSDGLVPWRERPLIFRKQSLARIPPQEKTA